MRSGTRQQIIKNGAKIILNNLKTAFQGFGPLIIQLMHIIEQGPLI
jgi:hypothetical protein